MNKPDVAKYIAKLQHEDWYVRARAAVALGEIGDAVAVPALIEALKDNIAYVSQDASKALEKIGAPAVRALIDTLNDTEVTVRYYAVIALGNIGDPTAITALIEMLEDQALRLQSILSLDKLGDAATLSRHILAHKRLSAQDKINLLDTLRRHLYSGFPISLLYKFPDTRTLCQKVLRKNDLEAREGAQEVLKLLDRNQLLRASERDTAIDSQELLRAAATAPSEIQPETLLRSSDEPEEKAKSDNAQPSRWQRLFGKRTDAA